MKDVDRSNFVITLQKEENAFEYMQVRFRRLQYIIQR